jgi:single-strand DNA-binding protein
MNKLRNHVQLVGRLGADTELKNVENGNALVNFSLATNDSYKDKDGVKQERTEWHRLTAWGKTAEIIHKYCKKGDEILVDGKLTHRSYDKDGETRYITEVQVNDVLLLGSKDSK